VLPPSVDTPPPRSREPVGGTPRWFVPAAVVGVLLLAVAGFVAGGSGGKDAPPARPATGVSASSAAVSLRGPSGWTRSTDTALPSVELQDPVAVASGGKRIVAGRASDDAANATLLPASLLDALGGPPPDPSLVELPGTGSSALRYDDLQVPGVSGGVTMIAQQASDGVYEVACLGGTTAGECDAAAAALKLQRGEAQDAGPSAAFAKSLSGVLGKLSDARASARRALASARDNRAQERAAARAAGAYGAAARRLGGVTARPSDAAGLSALRTAATDARSAWTALSRAARRNDRGAYGRARAQVRAAERALGEAMDQIKAAGYEVQR
jgi:hypothetical protein